VAEDNRINQKLIVALLERMGAKATLAANGLEAVELRKRGEYDLVLMDIQMPVMGGVEATQEILRYEKENGLPHVPIIAITANALHGDRERFLKAGLDEYLSKPIDRKKLLEIMIRLTGKSSKVKKGEEKEPTAKTEAPRDESPREKEAQEERPVSGKTEPPENPEESDDSAGSDNSPEESADTVSSAEEGKSDLTPALCLVCRPGLFRKLHEKFLASLPMDLETVDDLSHLTDSMKKGNCRYLILDAASWDAEALCRLMETTDGELRILLHGKEPELPDCFDASRLSVYRSMQELKDLLRVPGEDAQPPR
jgi:CheY-like chemotaxis protein